jgi:hypothetical protein
MHLICCMCMTTYMTMLVDLRLTHACLQQDLRQRSLHDSALVACPLARFVALATTNNRSSLGSGVGSGGQVHSGYLSGGICVLAR